MENRDYVYLDHAATTAVHPRVLEAMLPFFGEKYGNPSSVYSIARESRQAVDRARDTVANVIGARPNEVVFTSGGSESDNLAIKGVAFARRAKGNHLITTCIEHHAVLHTFEYLEKRFGFRVTYLPVDAYGVVDLTALERAVDEETTLVTIMAANNEVGTLQPIEEIGRFLKGKDIVFHTDAVQAMGSVPVNVDAWGVDMLSMSAHKFYGPKGTGCSTYAEAPPSGPNSRADRRSAAGGPARRMCPEWSAWLPPLLLRTRTWRVTTPMPARCAIFSCRASSAACPTCSSPGTRRAGWQTAPVLCSSTSRANQFS